MIELLLVIPPGKDQLVLPINLMLAKLGVTLKHLLMLTCHLVSSSLGLVPCRHRSKSNTRSQYHTNRLLPYYSPLVFV